MNNQSPPKRSKLEQCLAVAVKGGHWVDERLTLEKSLIVFLIAILKRGSDIFLSYDFTHDVSDWSYYWNIVFFLLCLVGIVGLYLVARKAGLMTDDLAHRLRVDQALRDPKKLDDQLRAALLEIKEAVEETPGNNGGIPVPRASVRDIVKELDELTPGPDPDPGGSPSPEFQSFIR